MANLFDYLAWRGDLCFKQSPFNCVDNLILSVLSYIPFDGVVSDTIGKNGIPLSIAAEKILAADIPPVRIRDKRDLQLLEQCARSVRFSKLGLSAYVNKTDLEEEKQFAALCIECPDSSYFVSFRGTDLTLVGWKEDFNMSFMCPVPSQTEALNYLNRIGSVLKGKLRIGGHSKGGNLAVYASAFCKKPVQNRILAVYNNDGPGFDSTIIAKDEYKRIEYRLSAFIPQSSIIGMMLEHNENFIVIESSESGLMQHDPYSWSVLGKDFIRADHVSDLSLFVDQTLKDWVRSIDTDKREKFIDALYEIITATEVRDLNELSHNWLKHASALTLTLIKTDEETRKQVQEILSVLFKVAGKNLPVLFPSLKPKKDDTDE